MKIATIAAVAGLVDAASFAATRRAALLDKPDRAAGTLAAMALWSGIARNAARGRRGRARAFAAASLIANSAMLAAHVRGKVANPRIATGTALSALALVGTLGRG